MSEDEALDKVAGYVLPNDVSERLNQKQRGTQWSKGKGHDTFCPVGPWLVTPDEIGDSQDLARRPWTATDTRPFVLEAIELVGADRCVVASDFPTDKLFDNFDDTLGALCRDHRRPF